MNNNNNAELIGVLKKSIAGGDEAAFRQLFDIFFDGIVSFIFSIVRSKDMAVEIADDVFINVWKRREHILQIDNLKVYLYKAAKNAALNYLSRTANRNITRSFDDVSIQLADESDPEKIIIAGEMAYAIITAVNLLPPRCKMIFKLVREDGLAYREVAEVLNLSVNTVDAQMVIATGRIREAVSRYIFSIPPKK